MCGIAGVLQRNGAPADLGALKRMTDVIAHRGPDGEGQHVDGPLGLGHRRLAIIDLSPLGHQPMLTEDGRYALSYNGEIYNFQDIRAELQAKGRRFRSRTDSEVVLQSWAEWGPAALKRFNGMFAFALWDRDRRELSLARDRYGIKPIYYAEARGAFLFGSEVKALLAHPALGAEMDPAALLEYMTFQNFFTDRTLFKHVRLLPAGCWLTLAAGAAPKVSRYWDFEFAEPGNPAPEAEYVEELDRLFRQAVRRQLVSDVPVNSYLSGGIDSGAVSAIAAESLPDMKTFTVGFDLSSASGLELGFDERVKAEAMSYRFKTEHYEMVLKAGDMERCMSRLVWHLEEPRVGQSYPNFYAAQLASKFGKVVLSGTGGDELFAGYPWRYYRAVSNDDLENYVDKYYAFWQRLIPADRAAQAFGAIWPVEGHISPRDIMHDVFRSPGHELRRPEDYVNHALYFEAKTFLHGVLVVDDKLSMAHGLEARVPFLDNDLVDFAMRVPTRLKLGNLGEGTRLNVNEPGASPARTTERARDGKRILRKVLSRYVPREISEGVKQGFSAPDASWFRGDSIEYVKQRLMGNGARIFDYLDRATMQGLIREHLDGRENRRLLIWSLLNLESWLDRTANGGWRTA